MCSLIDELRRASRPRTQLVTNVHPTMSSNRQTSMEACAPEMDTKPLIQYWRRERSVAVDGIMEVRAVSSTRNGSV